MLSSLSPNYDIEIFSNEQFTTDNLRGFDIVAFPGGIGDSNRYYDFFRRKVANTVADFVNNGGYYLGICMGAYWAGSAYFDILDGVDVVQYIKRPTADIRRAYGTVAKVDWLGSEQDMFFYDGCAILGNQDGSGNSFDVISRYANGDPMAIIQGRVGIIGCHPESEEFWYDNEYKYIKKHWHKGEHHKLLLDFVNKLVYNS